MTINNNVGSLIIAVLLVLVGCTQQNSEQEQMSASHPLRDTVVVKDLMVSGDSLYANMQRVPSCCVEGYFSMEFYTGGGWREFVTDLRHPRVKLAEIVSYCSDQKVGIGLVEDLRGSIPKGTAQLTQLRARFNYWHCQSRDTVLTSYTPPFLWSSDSLQQGYPDRP